MTKTKIMTVADIHGDARLVERLAKKAEDERVDVVVLAGDITMMERESSMKNIVGPFLKNDRKVLLLHGNHEGTNTIEFLSSLYPNTQNLHANALHHNDIGIFGVGGADFGVEPMSEDDFARALETAHYKIKDVKKKILVSHMHPARTMSEFSGFEGSHSITKAIYKFSPHIAVHGHIHEASGIEEKLGETYVINVSRKERIFEF